MLDISAFHPSHATTALANAMATSVLALVEYSKHSPLYTCSGIHVSHTRNMQNATKDIFPPSARPPLVLCHHHTSHRAGLEGDVGLAGPGHQHSNQLQY